MPAKEDNGALMNMNLRFVSRVDMHMLAVDAAVDMGVNQGRAGVVVAMAVLVLVFMAVPVAVLVHMHPVSVGMRMGVDVPVIVRVQVPVFVCAVHPTFLLSNVIWFVVRLSERRERKSNFQKQ